LVQGRERPVVVAVELLRPRHLVQDRVAQRAVRITFEQLLVEAHRFREELVLDRTGFSDILKEHSASIIHLKRGNLVKMTVSFFNSVRLADSTGDWNLYDESCRLPPITIEPKQFDAWLRNVEKAAQEEVRFVRSLKLPTLSLCYEELLVNEQKTFERIFSFLGLESWVTKGRAIKATRDDLRDAVENFEAIKSRYVGTRYEVMFDEVIAGR